MEKEKNEFHVTQHTFGPNDKSNNVMKKSNLHAEHKQMHKFTEVASGERGKKFMLLTTLFVRMIKVIKLRKVTYTLSISKCTSSQK